MNRSIYWGLSLILISVILFACDKSVKNNVLPAAATGQLYFHLHTYADINEVDEYNLTYTTSSGRKISVSLAQLYISNIQLEKSDGSFYTVPDTIVRMNQSTETYAIANVPAGQYKSLRFNVGLNPAQNALNATIPALNHSDMWFGSTAQPDGYVFVNFQGKIDTTSAANAMESQMQDFSYKIGTSSNFKQVIFPPSTLSVLPNTAAYAHILVDYYKLFNGVDLKEASNLSVNSVGDNSSALAVKIASNIPSMFSLE